MIMCTDDLLGILVVYVRCNVRVAVTGILPLRAKVSVEGLQKRLRLCITDMSQVYTILVLV